MSSLRLVLVVLAILVTGWPMAAGEVPAHVTSDGVSLSDQAGDVVLRVPLSRPVPWKVWLADAPPRLIVELNDVALDKVPQVASSSVVEMAVDSNAPGWTRLIAFLREPLSIDEAQMLTDSGEAALTVTLEPTTATAFRKVAKPLEPRRSVPTDRDRVVVVIDPGHGGRDPGAEAEGISEAELMLDFAVLLKGMLEDTGRFDVVLTRGEDAFVPLETRIRRARDAEADVFLSLHADALAEDAGHASGMTVYSLSEAAARAAATRQTERHAADGALMGVDLAGAGDDVAVALMSLLRQDTDPRTALLSAMLVDAFRASELAVNSHPERQGDFAVLKAAAIPSVLVELGFLSSDADLKRLISDEWQQEAAQALRDGLLRWYDEDRVLNEAMRK